MNKPLRVLFVANRLPYQGIAGGYSVIYKRILGLARRGHEVGLVAFSRDECEEQLDALRPYLHDIELVEAPPQRSFSQRLLDYFFAPEPSRFRDYKSDTIKKVIGDMVERSKYSLVVAEFLRMGQHLYSNPWLPAVRRVISCHRSLSMMAQTEIERMRPPLAWLWRLRIRGMEAYEWNLYKNMDHILVLTASDRLRTLSVSPQARVTIAPGGVDIERFTADFSRCRKHSVLFTGNFKDHANEDAALWFGKQVWPLLEQRDPQLTFKIVGPHATTAMRRMAGKSDRIVLYGPARDLRDALFESKVFVCPTRIGAGMRTKVLEAMASGIPVVSTILGVEGIPAHVGVNCMLADTPELMAEYVAHLLRDEELALSLARNARSMIEERFTWDISINRLEAALRRI